MLVGRDRLLAAGDAALAAAVGGRGGVVLVAGEAGIGKTTLARAIVERGRAAGAEIRWGASWDGASLLPFGPWIGCLRQPGDDACAAAAERLETGVDTATDVEGAERRRLRFFTEVVDALREVSARRPQIVVLEDVHWADTASLLLLQAVAPFVPAMAVLVVATYRDDELDRDGPLSSIGGGAERLTLDGLAEADVGRLLADVLGRIPSGDEVRTVHRQTAGNPLFVTQVGRLAAAGSSMTTMPVGTRGVLARRLARLSPECDRVLGVAAVLGTDFDVATVVAVVDQPEEAVLAALDEAAAARLVTQVDHSPDRWVFVHALVRAARYDALGTTERRRWHRRVVDTIAERPSTTAGVLAHHAALASFAATDARPAELAVDAAREALARLAWDEAAALAERALEVAPLGPAGDEVRADAWLALGDARLRTDDRERAADAFNEAAEIGRASGRPELVARAALGFGAGLGGFEVRLFDQRQLDLLEEATTVLPQDAPLCSLVLSRLSVALSIVGSDARRLGLADEAIALARQHDDERALAVALAARCDALAGPDHVTDRLGSASEIVAMAQRAGDLPLELLGRRLRVVALLELRDVDGVDTEVAAYGRAADRLGDPLYSWYVEQWRAMHAYADGRVADANVSLGEAQAIGAAAGSQNAEMLTTTLRLYMALDGRDRTQVDAVWAEMRARFPEVVGSITLGMTAQIDAHVDRRDRARATLDRCGATALDRLPRDQEWLTAVSQFLDAAVTCGDRDFTRHAYDLLSPYEGLGVFEGIAAVDHGVSDRYLALAAGHLGDGPAAARHAERAIAAVSGSGRLVVAHTHADCARGLFATGDDALRGRAMDLARSAVAEYDAMGFDRLADEVRSIAGAGMATAPSPADAAASLVREGETWAWTYGGATVRVRHAKGMADLAELLARPGREVHVRELEGGSSVPPPASEQPVLDGAAVAQYRQRLVDLEEDLDEADRHGDVGRASSLTTERDLLVEELTTSFGIGGRARRLGSDPDERLRKAVSARVRASIERIEALHPSLGRHLRASVRTGFWCSYAPERVTTWEVVVGRHR